jgi:AraC-like DNA-binding protein
MTSVDLLIFGSSCLLFGVSLFCANLLLLQDRYGICRPLVLFCMIQALLEGLVIPMVAGGPALAQVAVALNAVIALPLTLMLAPLFWLYVRRLTAEDQDDPIRWKALHLLPILIGTAFVLAAQTHSGLESGRGAHRHALIEVELIYYAQVAVYLVLCWRRIAAYQARLKDLFASTEDRELRWLLWIVSFTALYLVVDLAVMASDAFGYDGPAFVPSVAFWLELALPIVLTWMIAVWGSRQKPGLYRIEDRNPSQTAEPAGQKYERSALTQAQAVRIARKIKAAMETQHLYRDPNLSLWSLANQIGVTSNHVSQTLNESLGESFFNHVNAWRIKDAIAQLTGTDQPILTIAYDVGFNSRSPFYKAFKRETGMTPTEFRARQADRGAAKAALPTQDGVLPDVSTPAEAEGDRIEENRQGLHPHHRRLPA